MKQLAYQVIGQLAGFFFNVLNLCLGGNLPPFGCVAVIIHEEDRYLLLRRASGRLVFPGGFIRWHEPPPHCAQREVAEETGLSVRIIDLIGCFSKPSEHADMMSTLTLLYSAEITGGHLCSSIEGQPLWVSEAEIEQGLDDLGQRYLKSYVNHMQERQTAPNSSALAEDRR